MNRTAIKETVPRVVVAMALGLAALGVVVLFTAAANAQTLITDFADFYENESYASWNDPSAIIVSGPENYTITATGYGSNYVYIGDFGILGAGNTHLELDVTLSGPPAADGELGPIITLIDGDGTGFNFAWYGQLLGNHLLTMPVVSPTWVSAAGTVPGLDLDTLTHMHMQLDPAQFGATGAYTVQWNNLNLTEVEGIPGDFNADDIVDGADLLLWQQGDSPIPLSASDLADWEAHFGTPAPLTRIAGTAVPEPGAVGLLILATVAVAGRRGVLC